MNTGTLLVATAGGHIDELYELAEEFCPPGETRIWITSRTPQTTSLLEGEQASWVRPVGSRQLGAALKSLPAAWSLLRQHRPRRVITTGAAMAVPYLILARILRIECTYIESATRLYSPSVTGRVAEALRRIHLHTQNDTWARRRWTPVSGVFDGYSVFDRDAAEYASVLVTVGTERFGFRRAIDAVLDEVGPEVELSWQTGHTPVTSSLRGVHRAWWPAKQLAAAAAAADVVVTHAGVGSVLMALRAGKCPVVIPRTASRNEHIDDHQGELARIMSEKGLALVAQPGEPLGPLLTKAAGKIVQHRAGSTR